MIGHILYWLCIFPIAEAIEIIYTILYRVVDDYGIATVGLSFAVTLLTLPIYMVAERWQGVERDKEMAMAPKVGRIRKAFRGDERFMMLSAYYREQGYKPVYALRSAFSILVQIPFFLAAYAFLSNLPALRGCPFWVLEDLGSPDGLLRAGSVRVNVLPVVMTVANCVAGYLYTKGHPLREKVQVYGMAGLFLVVLYGSPSGLLVYWTMNNILSLVKNIFYKLRHPAKVLYFLCATASIALVILMLATHTGKPSTQAFLLFGAALVVCIPLELAFLKWVYRRWLTPLANSPRFRDCLFFLNMTGCALLLGVVVPSGLIVSSPTEFAFLEPYRNPLAFVGITFCQAVGLCLVWPFCLYRLFDKRIQAFLAIASTVAFCMALLNLFVFSRSYGSVLVNLQFTDISALGRITLHTVFDLLVIPLVCFFMLLLVGRWKGRVIVHLLVFAVLGLVLLGLADMVRTEIAYRRFIPRHEEMVRNNETKTSDLRPVFSFSRNGKNVLVIMIDRGMSCYVPYIFEEKPELREAFSGFTYYPNTISFGGNTIYGTPALYGGYEYTPVELNRRDAEPLRKKQNEALKVMPKLFADHGYEVEFTDPAWSNYNWDFDPTPFIGMDHVKVDSLKGRYNAWWLANEYDGEVAKPSAALTCNLIRYAFFRVSPLVFHQVLYDNGNWLNKLNPAMHIGGLNSEFLNQYSALAALPLITAVTDGGNRLNIYDTEATHKPTILQTPEYVPVSEPKNVLDTPFRTSPLYHVNAATYRKLADWFSYLKEQGVYDNTRIIIVSDHGWSEGSDAPGYLRLPNGADLNSFRAVLMVKDFGEHGAIRSDGTFMSVADVPELAAKKLIQNPVNPYTGKPLVMQKEGGVTMTSAQRHTPRDNKPNTFIVGPDEWLHVKDSILDLANWSIVQP